MKLLHLSSIENRDSILENGILPSKIILEPHLHAFKRDGLQGDSCVYTWNAERGQSTDKYIRDMIYCKLFIHPRNFWGDEYYKNLEAQGIKYPKDEQKLDYRQYGTKLFGDASQFDLFEINIDDDSDLFLKNTYLHGQLPDESPYDSCHLLNEKYAHDDKVLHISGSTIPPNMLKLVTTVKTRKYKNDTIGISYSKNQ